ncbi:MAG TPA: hypothetical protein EYF98_15130 [Planctomycetes bacterium]|nr:hypothetical protein [Planctomycetota bacterium]
MKYLVYFLFRVYDVDGEAALRKLSMDHFLPGLEGSAGALVLDEDHLAIQKDRVVRPASAAQHPQLDDPGP